MAESTLASRYLRARPGGARGTELPDLSDLLRMRRVSWLFVLTLVALPCLEAPAAARVSASDAAATHAYLKLRIALRQAAAGTESAAIKATEALEARVKAECPGVLAGEPPYIKGQASQSRFEITEELLAGVFSAAEHVQHPADQRFAKTMRRLRWSNPKLTRLLRSLALEEAEQSAIATPNLCADMQAWVSSGYTTVSAGTKSFLHRHDVVSSITLIEPEPHEPVGDAFHLDALLAHRLKPYEDHTDQLLAKKAIPPEAKITDPSADPIFEAAGKVLVALKTPAPTA